MSSYRLDRTTFKAQTAEEATKSQADLPQPYLAGALRIANYLNSVAYNYPEDSPPRMDKTAFKMRSRK